MRKSNLALIGVPIDCTGIAGVCDRAPWMFRKLGIRQAIGIDREFNDLSVRIHGRMRDPKSGVVGAESIVHANQETKGGVESILRAGLTPIMLGGCCSYLMGAFAAARRVYGRVGLAYVDGHMDLYDGKTSPGGECADMPLAFLLGKGPDILDQVMESTAPATPDDVSLIGYRDRYLAEPQGSVLPEDFGGSLHHLDAVAVRSEGMVSVAQNVLARQATNGRRFWLHLDWDVLDERVLPSADYLMPGGFNVDEMVALVRPLVQSGNMIGMSTACYNPDNDHLLKDGRKLVDAMGKLFA